MNKPYFYRIFFLRDWRHKRLKNTIDILLFHWEHFCGFSESGLVRSISGRTFESYNKLAVTFYQDTKVANGSRWDLDKN